MIEQTLIIVKHDGVLKGIIGEIIKRFENTGLKIVGLKMLLADDHLASNHYLATKEWAEAVFKNTKETYENKGKKFEYSNPLEYGKLIQNWNKNFLKEGPVVAIILEGPHAIELCRKIVGSTEPRQALPGTIRGDYTFESYELADNKKRPVRNIVHASGSVEEAKREISLWFKKNEIHDYKHHHPYTL